MEIVRFKYGSDHLPIIVNGHFGFVHTVHDFNLCFGFAEIGSVCLDKNQHLVKVSCYSSAIAFGKIHILFLLRLNS